MNAPGRLVVGLGNPGERYADTRHNLGWMVVDACVRQRSAELLRSEDDRHPSRLYRSGGALFAQPTASMNRSGAETRRILRYYRLRAEDMLVVSDDLDLPFGELRFRDSGGAGGHKGLGDIVGHVGTETFARLRIGIGRPPAGTDPADFVLQRFTKEEAVRLPAVIKAAAERIGEWLDG